MKKTIITAALAALLSAGALSAASAAPAFTAPQALSGNAVEQVHYKGNKYGHHRILPQRVVIRSLYRQGYRDIRNVRLVRGDYVMRARGYRGPVRLVVDGRSGRILSRQALNRGHHGPRPGFSLHGGNGNFTYSFGIR